MNKSKKKRTYYNQSILLVIQERYGYSLDYIRKSLRGDRTGILPDKLIEEYKKLEQEANQAINNKADEL
jgi:hypothetical protein